MSNYPRPYQLMLTVTLMAIFVVLLGFTNLPWLPLATIMGFCLLLIWLAPWPATPQNHPQQLLPPPPPDSNPIPPGHAPLALIETRLQEGFSLQLRLLQAALSLTSAVLIGPGSDPRQLQVLAGTSNQQLSTTPFPPGSGVLGGLTHERSQVAGHPNSPHFQGLPYYDQGDKIGGFLAMVIPPEENLRATHFLCLDRLNPTPWQEDEIALAQATAAKIGLDLFCVAQFNLTNQQILATSQVCNALQELNTALGTETAFAAVERAIQELTGAEFIALTLVEDNGQTIVRAVGDEATNLVGQHIADHQTGLIGQAVKLCHEMPHNFTYQEPAPIFHEEHPIKGFKSLLILPLWQGEKQVIGTLVMAGKQPGLFNKERLGILKLVGTQIATKIDLAQAHEKINQLATTDGLTGLANRRAMEIGFELMIKRAKRAATPLTIILGDIDFFKQINDNFGHPFGDEVLRQISKILRDSMRAEDLACRYGGEEFLLILENSDIQGGWQLAERLRHQVATATFQPGGQQVTVTMSFGIASSAHQGLDRQDLIAAADLALYQAKEQGRNQSVKSAP